MLKQLYYIIFDTSLMHPSCLHCWRDSGEGAFLVWIILIGQESSDELLESTWFISGGKCSAIEMLRLEVDIG